MKRLLFMIALVAALPAFAMDEQDTVTLKSADGQDFKVEVRVAFLSKTIKNLAEDAIPGQSIPLFSINGRTLAKIVELLKHLDLLLAHNKTLNLGEQKYIPRLFQRYVNASLQDLKNEEVGHVFDAANYLDIPFILNAVGAVIADRLTEGFTGIKLHQPLFKSDERKPKEYGKSSSLWDYVKSQAFTHLALRGNLEEDMLYRYRYYGFGEPNKDTTDYILKHLVFRRCGAKEEYSIADYLDDYEAPLGTWTSSYAQGAGLNFSQNDPIVTSLFGLNRIKNPEKIEALNFDSQCLFDPSLDLQSSDITIFAVFPKLRYITLKNNPIKNKAALQKYLGKLQLTPMLWWTIENQIEEARKK